MDVGLMVEPHYGGTYNDLVGIARWAESQGFSALARSDHYWWNDTQAATDAFVTLGGLARETSSIRLTVLVSPITFRHPAVIAKCAVTIDEMSGGRLDLGVGTGWLVPEHEVFGLDFPTARNGSIASRNPSVISERYSPDRRSRDSTTG